VLLASLDRDELHGVLAEPTDQAAVPEFLEESPAIRENGYAFGRISPSAPDFSAVSRPVHARNGSVLAAVTLAGRPCR
jgi:DNA-binding IclR family transcriptional regulator